MKKLIYILLLSLCVNAYAESKTMRLWTMPDGERVDGVFVRATSKTVYVLDPEGEEFKLVRKTLCRQDQVYVTSFEPDTIGRFYKGSVLMSKAKQYNVSYQYAVKSKKTHLPLPVVFVYYYYMQPDKTVAFKAAPRGPEWVTYDSGQSRKVPVATLKKVRGKVPLIESKSAGILFWRIELWCDHKLLDSIDTSTAEKRKKYKIPPKWWYNLTAEEKKFIDIVNDSEGITLAEVAEMTGNDIPTYELKLTNLKSQYPYLFTKAE